jgi:SAM-dependent methyltransferase
MRPSRWQHFMWLQTDAAYPDGPQEVAACHVKRASSHQWIGVNPDRAVLVFGPGRVEEINAVRAWLQPVVLCAVTALQREADALYNAHACDIAPVDMHDTQLRHQFDLVFSSNVLEHAIAPFAVLLEMRRLLKDNGDFYAIVPTFETPSGGYGPFHLSCLSEELWLELMRKAGLQVVHSAKVAEIPFAEREHYYHFHAKAVTPPPPYDALLERIRQDV